MMDLHNYKDLEEHFSSSILFFKDHNQEEKRKQNLKDILEKIKNNAEYLKVSENDVALKLQMFQSESTNQKSINVLYADVKESYNNIRNEYNKLLNEKNDLQDLYSLEKLKWEKKQVQEKALIVEELSKQIKTLENTITEQKDKFAGKENELHNQLHLVQASRDLQYDEMESQLKSLKLELQGSHQSCNAVREEYLSFKTHAAYEIDSANKYIDKLESKLRYTEQQVRLLQEQLFHTLPTSQPQKINLASTSTKQYTSRQSFVNSCKSPIVVYNNPQYTTATSISSSKYDALEVENVSHSLKIANTDLENQQNIVDVNKVVKEVTKSLQLSTANPKRKIVNNKPSLPPLKSLTKGWDKPNSSKKVKLFNVGSLDYLNNVEQE